MVPKMMTDAEKRVVYITPYVPLDNQFLCFYRLINQVTGPALWESNKAQFDACIIGYQQFECADEITPLRVAW